MGYQPEDLSRLTNLRREVVVPTEREAAAPDPTKTAVKGDKKLTLGERGLSPLDLIKEYLMPNDPDINIEDSVAKIASANRRQKMTLINAEGEK
ncbi:8924_t:CDS:2 [Funneliformis geosporum]|nr:8924_t:CDS:2 [Funneliformis geosporum]